MNNMLNFTEKQQEEYMKALESLEIKEFTNIFNILDKEGNKNDTGTVEGDS